MCIVPPVVFYIAGIIAIALAIGTLIRAGYLFALWYDDPDSVRYVRKLALWGVGALAAAWLLNQIAANCPLGG
ncbi:MAG: hypothetical protein HY474_00960 [Candidatus Sungbacteria bacterium]|uniref:Uncharacterized protein n=1 Tax=Candidatus Sungiibacteriota bacterium TaxID=2750080 RepID=A0A932YW66_9BACT|nr:hypothetical protein [Candidatus Sungbacteria bacterium]